MRKRNKSVRRSGFTLIEIVTSLIVIGICAGIVTPFVRQVTESLSMIVIRRELTSQAGLAMNWMVREIREIGVDKGELEIPQQQNDRGACPARMVFTKVNEETVTYELAGDEITRNGFPLCENVSALTFTYRDDENQTLIPPPAQDCLNPAGVKAVHHVIVDVTFTRRQETYRLSSWVVPRNIIME